MFNSIDIELNTDCNFRCKYCPNSNHSKGHESLPDMVLFDIIQQLGTMDYCGRISPNLYGEPLMCDGIVGKLGYMRTACRKAKIHLYTNGSKLTEALYNKVEPNVDKVIITLHEQLKPSWFTKQPAKKMVLRPFSRTDKLHNRCGLVDHPWCSSPTATCFGKGRSMYIDHKGDALLCCNDYWGENSYGHVSDVPLIELDELIEKDREKLREGVVPHPTCVRCNCNV